MMRKTILTMFAVSAMVLGFSSPALAQSSAGGYDETGGVLGATLTHKGPGGPQVLGASAVRPAASAPVATATPTENVGNSGSSLPFTGLDLTIVALMGLALVGTGLALRRTSRRPDLT